jgi:hypothetical protein
VNVVVAAATIRKTVMEIAVAVTAVKGSHPAPGDLFFWKSVRSGRWKGW